MSTNLHEFFDELDNSDDVHTTESLNGRTDKRRLSKKREMEAKLFIRAQELSNELQFTYKAARFEEVWLLDSLNGLAEYNWISDVLQKLKAGKEASVYLCKTGAAIPETPLAAAKIYRPRTLRNLKNDSQYREGRTDLDGEGRQIIRDGDLHAIAKRTAYGEELRHQSWIAYEFTTLQRLFEAGADVPRPYTIANNAILMEYIGDEDACAPTLNGVHLTQAEAKPLFQRLLNNLDVLLENDAVHSDLSAYNILYWDGAITLIDFPQVVSPRANRNAFPIFVRDVTRVCEYFAKHGVEAAADPRGLASTLWTRHGLRVREEIHPSLLDSEDPRDRQLWERQNRSNG